MAATGIKDAPDSDRSFWIRPLRPERRVNVGARNGRLLVRAADAFDLEHEHVVGPDVGTAASLFAAAAHPGRFLSLIVGTGGTAVPIQLGDPLREWVFAPDLEPYRRIGGRLIVERAMQTLEHYVPSDIAREDYLASYEGDRFAESMRYVQSYLTELQVLQGMLPQIHAPVQIVAGRKDMVVPPVNAEGLHERLPHRLREKRCGSRWLAFMAACHQRRKDAPYFLEEDFGTNTWRVTVAHPPSGTIPGSRRSEATV